MGAEYMLLTVARLSAPDPPVYALPLDARPGELHGSLSAGFWAGSAKKRL